MFLVMFFRGRLNMTDSLVALVNGTVVIRQEVFFNGGEGQQVQNNRDAF